jgi:hypothetical protein
LAFIALAVLAQLVLTLRLPPPQGPISSQAWGRDLRAAMCTPDYPRQLSILPNLKKNAMSGVTKGAGIRPTCTKDHNPLSEL